MIRQQKEMIKHDTAPARIIAVASGKGGVGKSNIVLNYALTLCQMGERILIVDGDIGFANIDILLGMRPVHTLEDVLVGNVKLQHAMTMGAYGLGVVSGGSSTMLDEREASLQMARFAQELSTVQGRFDRIYLDFGAGFSKYATEMIGLCDAILLVITPEPTALADAYSLIKRVAKRGPLPKIELVINRAQSVGQATEAAGKFTVAAQKFLFASPDTLGYVLEDDAVHRAVYRQIPFVLGEPNSIASKCVQQLAKNSVTQLVESYNPPRGLKQIWERFAKKRQV